MFTIILDDTGMPLYAQIYEFIKNEIAKGNIPYREKLPSKRKLATHLSVSVNTVDTAYSQLVAEGYVEAIPQKGYFVCEIDEYLQEHHALSMSSVSIKSKSNDIKIDFSPGDIDSGLFPFNSFRKVFKSVYNEYDVTLIQKPELQGDIGLRRALTDFLYRSRGVKCLEEQIIIGSGTDNLLQTLSLLFGRDKTIVCENPIYLKAYNIFKSMGNKVMPIDIDEKGIQVEPIKQLSNIAVYITPSHHFPLGVSMPIDRRIKLLNLANKSDDMYIIEDDYDSEFRYNERPLPSLQSIDKGGKVIYMGTFSKSVAPSIRISYMVLPKALIEVYLEKFTYVCSPASVLEQKMLAEFVRSGSLEVHINKMRKLYKEKRLFLIGELNKLGHKVKIIGENAGHHLLVKLKTGLTEQEMCSNALLQGVKVYPISTYFINGIPQKYQNEVLLGYGALTFEQIRDGVKSLGRAWQI